MMTDFLTIDDEKLSWQASLDIYTRSKALLATQNDDKNLYLVKEKSGGRQFLIACRGCTMFQLTMRCRRGTEEWTINEEKSCMDHGTKQQELVTPCESKWIPPSRRVSVPTICQPVARVIPTVGAYADTPILPSNRLVGLEERPLKSQSCASQTIGGDYKDRVTYADGAGKDQELETRHSNWKEEAVVYKNENYDRIMQRMKDYFEDAFISGQHVLSFKGTEEDKEKIAHILKVFDYYGILDITEFEENEYKIMDSVLVLSGFKDFPRPPRKSTGGMAPRKRLFDEIHESQN